MNSKLIARLVGVMLVAGMGSVSSAADYQFRGGDVPPKAELQMAEITPLSMQYFCAQNKSQCAGGGQGQVAMTSNLMALLKQVNVHVNRAITPERDVADTWELNPTSGDCEDYVLSKRSALMQQGVSSGALRIAYTHTRSGEPHAVLIVRTSEGDLVLDNLSNTIRTLPASGYNIRSMSSSNPASWTAS